MYKEAHRTEKLRYRGADVMDRNDEILVVLETLLAMRLHRHAHQRDLARIFVSNVLADKEARSGQERERDG